MINPPSLQQLKYLISLAETRHFARAADACAVTQSTLSAGNSRSTLRESPLKICQRGIAFRALWAYGFGRMLRLMGPF